MSSSKVNNSLMVKNTMLLYVRMLLLMVVSLYTGRVVLSSLGIVDYGIYNVVGGFIGLFAFLNGAMSSGSQRYITYALGKGDAELLKKVFSTCRFTHAIIALLVLILAQTLGLWFVLEKLVIPADRTTAAIVVYECSVLSTIITIMSYPYNADIVAHEKMSAFAYISLYEAIAKLAIVFLLVFAPNDKLILYAILLLVVQLSVRIIYNLYCHKHFEESNSGIMPDRLLLKEMFAFTGWNLWGGLSGALFTQGVNVLLNMFFGPAVNAARGVSVQVQNAVQQFSINFQMAINPQITKTYAANDLESMHSLIFRSSKFTFMILMCMILPICLETEWILDLWLKEVPQYAVQFVRLMLCITILDSVANPIMIASAATGKVKSYQMVIGSVLLLIVPLSYIAIKQGGEPYCVFIVHLAIAAVAFILRIAIVAPMIKLRVTKYLMNVSVPCLVVLLASLIPSVAMKLLVPDSGVFALAVCAVSFVISLVVSYFLGLSVQERNFIAEKFRKIIHAQ